MDAIPPVSSGGPEDLAAGSPSALLDFLIPGFSIYATAVSKYLHIDLNLYIPLVLLFGGLIFVWRYFSEYFSGVIESHLMSVVDIRPDDEIYNMLMAWVANQRFARSARRFVVNTNVNSRSWMLWRSFEDDEEDEEEEGEDHDYHNRRRKKRALAYTPTFGSHWFLYKNRILIFKRTQNSGQNSFLTASEREEISISCFGRNPWVLKELLHEAREVHMKRDEAKTLIYRGTTRSGSTEPVWQRSMARTSRPFSTVILNEKVKKDLIDDVTDYLNPATQRWYSNRGIPYRRGYLLHGPPGTGKSSLSLALAGFFKMRIYIVSLSSVTANEENLATLFAELPRRCVVLLEDIDTAGLTHTRDNAGQDDSNDNDNDNDENTTTKTRSSRAPGQNATTNNNNSGRLSLSGLLNILDGVSSQEGRVLIMTTNHIEKLDKALIRPGRVDMIVKFDRADTEMTAAIFRAIYAPLEGDDAPSPSAKSAPSSSAGTIFQFTRHSDDSPTKSIQLTDEEEKARAAEAAEAARKKEETIARVDVLAAQFAAKIPAHEFSPAEIQGYLLKNKRDPERTVAGAEEWVAETRKAKKEKELKEAEEKREREEKERKEKEEEEKKKKKEEEEEKKKKEEGEEKKRKKKGKKEKEKRKGAKKSKKKAAESESSGSESSSEEESESEAEKETSKKRSKAAAAVAPVEEKAPAPEIKVEPASVPAITVDTDKAKEAAVEQQKTPQGADSGYGTP